MAEEPKVVDRLSIELRLLIPGTNGFARQNLDYVTVL